MTIIGDNYGEIDTETGECTTISDIEREYFSQQKTKKMFPYLWTAGVISELSKKKMAEQTDKHCTICGEKKQLTHEHLSGGQTHYICEDCAVDYVLKAESVKIKYEQKKTERVSIELRTPKYKMLQIILPAFDAEELKSVIEEWAEEYGLKQVNVEVLSIRWQQ